MRDLFQVNGYGKDFFTGWTNDGRQVLMGLLCPNLVAYFFSRDGILLGREVRLWNYPASRFGNDGPYQIYDAEFERHLAKQLADWQDAIGFEPQSIQVRSFFDEELWVGVRELSSTAEGGDWDEEDVIAWQAEGVYELFWSKVYLMSATGEVEAT